MLLAKAVSRPVSVVKADNVQDVGATNCVRSEIHVSILWLPMALRFVTFLLDCTFGKMMLPCLKGSIPAGFCKLNLAGV